MAILIPPAVRRLPNAADVCDIHGAGQGEEMPWLEQLESRSFLFRRWRERRKRAVVREARRHRRMDDGRTQHRPARDHIGSDALASAVVFGFSTRTGSRCGLSGATACQ